MKITFYQLFGCPNNKIDKTNYLINAMDVTGTMRENLSKERPSILINSLYFEGGVIDSDNLDVIDNDNIDIIYEDDIESSNYCYIHELDRYYFIDSVSKFNNQLTKFDLIEDPLMSFKDGILNERLFITRRARGMNNIKDDLLQYEYIPEIIKSRSEITDLIHFDTFLDSLSDRSDKYCVVVTVLGVPYVDFFDKYGVWYLGETKNNKLGDIPVSNKFSNVANYNSRMALITPKMLCKIFTLLYTEGESVKSFIRSIIILPYEPEKYLIDENKGISHKITFGEYSADFDDDLVYEVKYGNNDVIHAYRIDIPAGTTYEDYEPFKELSLYLPFADTVKLDLTKARGMLDVYYYTNYINNQSSVFIYNRSTKMLIASVSAHLGVSIPLDTTNAFQKQLAESQIGTNLALGSLGNIMSMGQGIASGNGFQIGQSIVNEFSDLTSAYFQSLNNRSRASVSTLDSNTASFMILSPYLIWQNLKCTLDEYGLEQFYNTFGKPYYKFETLKNLYTDEFFIVGNTNNMILEKNMTNYELETIKGLLAKGVYK